MSALDVMFKPFHVDHTGFKLYSERKVMAAH